jgi:hypothetical protein
LIDQPGDLLLEAMGLHPRHTKIGQPNRFALAHRDAAGDLGKVFAKAGAEQQTLGFAKPV